MKVLRSDFNSTSESQAMKVLLLGCGKVRNRNIFSKDGKRDFLDDDLITIDIDPSCEPDIIMDLCGLSKEDQLPFLENTFDELHAYDVIEHLGMVGDWRGFFTEFKEYHRVLKPGGLFYILVPIGEESLADPGHSRFFNENHFMFLSQKSYENRKDASTTMTDYRWFWKKNFEVAMMQRSGNHHLAVILRKA